MTYRYFINLAYNGLAYSGWQIQPNGDTVQQRLEHGLSVIAGLKTGITGCGRTDTGVHATQFYAHFDHTNAFTAFELEQLAFKLNRYLPQDIVVYSIVPVIPGAHARFSAMWREYEYLVIRQKDPFRFQRAYFVHEKLDISAMNQAGKLISGRHDFQSFSKVNTQVNNFICDIHSARWEEKGHVLQFNIRADRFLRNMVRAIVGTMLDVGRGKITIEDFQHIINSKNRCEAGYSVPAKGLTLTGIGYPEIIFTDKPVGFAEDGSAKIISHYYADGRLQVD
jgi:tRNA pseudouridine38-40 synthase